MTYCHNNALWQTTMKTSVAFNRQTSILAHESRGWLSSCNDLSWASGTHLCICGQLSGLSGRLGTGWSRMASAGMTDSVLHALSSSSRWPSPEDNDKVSKEAGICKCFYNTICVKFVIVSLSKTRHAAKVRSG